MANNLIGNETNVFYTVEVKVGVWVHRVSFYSGKVNQLEVTTNIEHVEKYVNKEQARKVVEYVNGKVIKHTRTTVITEVTEEIKLEEEK